MTSSSSSSFDDYDDDDVHTLGLKIFSWSELPPEVAGRLAGDHVLAHLSGTGPAAVDPVTEAGFALGHMGSWDIERPDFVAVVDELTARAATRDGWPVPTLDGLLWWIEAADFRGVSREQYLAAFPALDPRRARDL